MPRGLGPVNTAYSSNNDRSFLDQQNKVRGAIAALRSRAFTTSQSDPLGEYRRKILRLYSSARAELPTHLYDDFLDWMGEIGRVVPEQIHQPIGFDYLHGFIPFAKKVPLAKEFAWISKRLKKESSVVNTFRVGVGEIERLVLENNIRAAIEQLDRLSKAVGETYWAVQLRIALAQYEGGLEAQKQVIEGVRKKFKGGALAFVAYYTGGKE